MGFLSKKEADFLNVKDPRTPVIYTLPKIHKNMTMPPGRPIVSGCGSILEPLGQYVNYFIKDVVPSTTYFVRDSMDMINLIDQYPFDPDKNILCTMDIESLYTNIPQELALNVVMKTLKQRPRPHAVPTNFILQLLELCLTRNFFQFESEFFQQIKGTCMGAIFAPSLAILVMDSIETNIILHQSNPFVSAITIWRRYIDDIFLIWENTEETLQQHLHWLNNNCFGLKFTMSTDHASISFLDLTIYHKGGVLLTKLYRKPTERNTLLSYKSNHPRALRDSLPYSQFLRIRRNCSEKDDYFLEASILSEKLKARGYPKRLVKTAAKRAWYCPREVLLSPREKVSSNPLVCVTTFSPASNGIKKSITGGVASRRRAWSHCKRLCKPSLANPSFIRVCVLNSTPGRHGRSIKHWGADCLVLGRPVVSCGPSEMLRPAAGEAFKMAARDR